MTQKTEQQFLRIVGNEPSDSDPKSAESNASRLALIELHKRLSNGREKALKPGMLAQWKPALMNRKRPDYGEPLAVIEVLDPPIIDSTFDSGSPYYREPLGIVLGWRDEDGDLITFHYDSRRFEPYEANT